MPVNCGPKGLPTDTNLLYRNRGDGTFADVSDASGVSKVTGRYSMTAVTTDLDGDGWPDIYVASDSTAAILYRNNRDGTFTDVAVESGAAYSENGNAQAGMGVAVGDYNGDGLLDILKTHFADDMPSLYRNLGKGLFEDVASAAGLAVENRYVAVGRRDARSRQRRPAGSLLRHRQRLPGDRAGAAAVSASRARGSCSGTRAGHASSTSRRGAATPRSPHSSRGAAFGDIDNDGDIDVLVMNMNEPPSLLRNDYAGGHGWIEIALEGTRSNRSAIGATVVVSRRRARRRRARC